MAAQVDPELLEAVQKAILAAQPQDQEGALGTLAELLDFSGENKLRLVAQALAGAAIQAVRAHYAQRLDYAAWHLSDLQELCARPLVNPLETGFRHGPLTAKEREHRYLQASRSAAEHVSALMKLLEP